MTRKEIRKEYRLKKRELKKNFNNDKRELEKEYINKINEVLEIDQTKEVPFRYTLEEIGKTYHVTRERVRQIEARALRKIKYMANRKNSLKLLMR